MFARYFSVLILALPVLTAASAIPSFGGASVNGLAAPADSIPPTPTGIPPTPTGLPPAPTDTPPAPTDTPPAPTDTPPAPTGLPPAPSGGLPPAPPVPTPSAPSFSRRDGVSGPSDQCITGVLQCCDSTAQTPNELTGFAATVFNVVSGFVGPVTAAIGVTCNPITGIGASGNSCSAQPVCCTNNSFNGVIALGCSPINGNA